MSSKLKILFTLSIGTIIELYDFSLFGFYAAIFTKYYFPANDVLSSYLITFIVFSICHLFRPIGAIIFGYLADKKGRLTSLSYSIIIMSLFTFAIGILPTYKQIGIISPLILIICRIGQVLCMGGEYTNALVYAAENFVIKKHRAFICSIITASAMLGWLLGVSITIIFTIPQLEEYWRIPIIIGAVGSIFGYYLRINNSESTKVLVALSNITVDKAAKLKILKENMLSYLIGACIGVVIAIFFLSQFVFLNAFLPLVTNISLVATKFATMIGITFYILWLITIGYFLENIGQVRALKVSAVLQLIFSILFYYTLTLQSYNLLIFNEVFAAFILALFVVSATYQMTQLFDIRIRALSVSISYGIGVCLGGFAPSILMMLYKRYNNFLVLGILLLLSSFLSYLVSLLISKQLINNKNGQ